MLFCQCYVIINLQFFETFGSHKPKSLIPVKMVLDFLTFMSNTMPLGKPRGIVLLIN